jgi:hypothetical protein
VVALACVLVGLGLVRLHDRTPVHPVGPSKTVDGYPRDVPRPFFEPPLPAAPGPAAGAVESDGAWDLVDASGHVWQLPAEDGYSPALSDDGVWLAMMRSDGPKAGHLEVRNLVTGSVQPYPDVGEGHTKAAQVIDQPFWTYTQSPGFWSPDGTQLLLPGESVSPPHGAGLLLQDGRVSVVRADAETPLGWTSPSTLAWLVPEVRGNTVFTNRHDLVVTDVDGHELRRVELQDRPRLTFIANTALSPDGTKLAVLAQAERSVSIRVFSLVTGEELPEAGVAEADELGAPVWRGDDILYWTGEELVDPAAGKPVVRLSQRWGAASAVWASQALTGPAQGGPSLFGWRYWPVWWWWRWMLGILAGAVVVGGIWWLDRRDRRKLRAAT